MHPAFLSIPTSLDIFYRIIFVLRHKSIAIVFPNFNRNLKLLGVVVELSSLNTLLKIFKKSSIMNIMTKSKLASVFGDTDKQTDIHGQCTVTATWANQWLAIPVYSKATEFYNT